MRLLVLPISRAHSLLYCQKVNLLPLARTKPRLDERLEQRASQAWEKFANTDVQWRKSIVNWVEKMLTRIPYEEWSLKSIPARTKYLRKEVGEKDSHVSVEDLKSDKTLEIEPITVHFPGDLISESTAYNRTAELALKGEIFHRKYMIYCGLATPLTLPIAILPIIPNIPGFYLLYRTWSHWKALQGAQHLSALIKAKELTFINDPLLNDAYRYQNDVVLDKGAILTKEIAKKIAAEVGDASLERELIRAIEQVKKKVDKSFKPEAIEGKRD